MRGSACAVSLDRLIERQMESAVEGPALEKQTALGADDLMRLEPVWMRESRFRMHESIDIDVTALE